MHLLSAFLLGSVAALASAAPAAGLPDKSNPDYIYCEDFESGSEQTGALPKFAIHRSHGVREGAGCESKFGYSKVLVENHGIPPYPMVFFPRHEGVIFVHYQVKVPANFYLGRADHGYYLGDSANKAAGRSVVDHASDLPLWLDPEWDPNSFGVLRGSGYHRMVRSFEGFAPVRRGEWHSYQLMVVPSQKDPSVGRMKVWIDGVLANFCKHDTIPSFNYFWLSNYWHSWEYVKKDRVSNIFETHTAPPHPAFEILLDNLVVSRQFIEYGPNKAQVERVRFTDIEPDGFTLRFDTTVPARKVSVLWGEEGAEWRAKAKTTDGTPGELGLFHTIGIGGLEPGKRYAFVAVAEDAKGRHLDSAPVVCTARDGTWPDFDYGNEQKALDAAGPWKGEIFAGGEFEGTPLMVRSFDALSYIAWSANDSELGVETKTPLSIRYTRKAQSVGGPHVFRFGSTDGLRVLFDGEKLFEETKASHGRMREATLRRDVAAGTHAIAVEHTFLGGRDWLQFGITAGSGGNPPVCFAQDIYNTRFYKPEQAYYCGRWSTEVEATVAYGETPAYGQVAKGRTSRYPYIKFAPLEIGKTYHWRVTAVDGLGNRTVTPDATFVCGDTLAPRKILLPPLERVSDTALRLTFWAPGEDGRHGQAAAYDIRWSDQPLSVVNWDKATRLSNPPTPQSKQNERIVLEGLPKGKTWYVAARAIDKAGQAGLLSNIVSDPPGPEVMDCDGDGYGVGSLLGFDPDDYDPAVPGNAGSRQSSIP